jgi:hypothetical protein
MSFLGSVRETENTQYPNTVGDFEYVRATGVYASRDEQNLPTSLLLGASGSVRLESREDLTMTLGENAKFLLYDINNTNLLSVYETSSGVGTNVLSDSKLILSSSVPSNTVIVGNVQLDTTGTGFDSVTSIRSILGGTLRLGGDVSFEKATLTRSDSNIVDADFFSRSLQIWKNIAPANRNIQTGELEYNSNDPDMVGFQLVINDNNRLEINKYTRFVGSDSTSRTHVKKLTAAFGVSDLTHDMVSTTDNSHFSRTFGSSNDIPAGVDNGHSGLWYEALQNTGVWIDRKVGIGINDPLYNLHVIGDVDAGDKISTNLPIETTSYVRAQTILTESDSRVKEKVVTIDPYTSENIISKLRPCTYTQLTGDKKRIDGFIAQEVREAVPSAVTVRQSPDHGIDDFHYLEAMPLISHLVATVQRLTDRVRALENHA